MRSAPLLAFLLACTGADKPDTGDTGAPASTDPDIALDPGLLAFGSVPVGASDVQTVTLANVGGAPLEIHAIYLEDFDLGDIFTISAVDAVLLPPGEETAFTVTFAPSEAVDYESRVLVGSNDPDEPEAPVSLTGSGAAP